MDLENQRYGRNKDTLVNKTYIESGEYRRKFDCITDNPKVNKALYDCAKKALKHRSGTMFEDMYWIDGISGKIIAEALNEQQTEAVIYSDYINKAIKGKLNLIAIHSHPQSMPPSIFDFNSAYTHGYRIGIIVCHDGKIFCYSSLQETSEIIYNIYIGKYIDMGYNEFDAQLKTLEKLKENHAIEFWEVL